MNVSSKVQRSLLGLAGALLVSWALVSPALAVDSVSQEITSGNLTASIADATLAPFTYSHAGGHSAGTLNLTVDDATGLSAGWSVAVSSGNFSYTGTSVNGVAIPNTGFVITSLEAPVATAGQAVNLVDGPISVSGGSLNSPRTTIEAHEGFGSGTYTQALTVDLLIPALSQAGSYNAILTVATTAAP
jgi:hypothetical protein